MEEKENYSISEVSEMMNIPISTIRYYESQHLLPRVKRNASGYRMFDNEDIERLSFIACLKSTGMSLQDIWQYFSLSKNKEDSLEKQYALLLERQKGIDEQVRLLQTQQEHLNKKIIYLKRKIDEKNCSGD